VVHGDLEAPGALVKPFSRDDLTAVGTMVVPAVVILGNLARDRVPADVVFQRHATDTAAKQHNHRCDERRSPTIVFGCLLLHIQNRSID
jgi:hypothetical protein